MTELSFRYFSFSRTKVSSSRPAEGKSYEMEGAASSLWEINLLQDPFDISRPAEGKSYEMEGAASSLWEKNLLQVPFDIEEFSAAVFAEPSPIVTSAELASDPFQNTTETNRKRKVSGATRDAAAEKKRLVDKEYRERCKVRRIGNEERVVEVTKENNQLREENNQLREVNARLVMEVVEAKAKQQNFEQELSYFKVEQSHVNKKLSKKLKRISADMVKIDEGLQRIRAGQKEVREKYEEISKETAKLKEETNTISKQSAANQVKLDLMFQIVKEGAENDERRTDSIF